MGGEETAEGEGGGLCGGERGGGGGERSAGGGGLGGFAGGLCAAHGRPPHDRNTQMSSANTAEDMPAKDCCLVWPGAPLALLPSILRDTGKPRTGQEHADEHSGAAGKTVPTEGRLPRVARVSLSLGTRASCRNRSREKSTGRKVTMLCGTDWSRVESNGRAGGANFCLAPAVPPTAQGAHVPPPRGPLLKGLLVETQAALLQAWLRLCLRLLKRHTAQGALQQLSLPGRGPQNFFLLLFFLFPSGALRAQPECP